LPQKRWNRRNFLKRFILLLVSQLAMQGCVIAQRLCMLQGCVIAQWLYCKVMKMMKYSATLWPSSKCYTGRRRQQQQRNHYSLGWQVKSQSEKADGQKADKSKIRYDKKTMSKSRQSKSWSVKKPIFCWYFAHKTKSRHSQKPIFKKPIFCPSRLPQAKSRCAKSRYAIINLAIGSFNWTSKKCSYFFLRI
jgi:hypothetical protein